MLGTVPYNEALERQFELLQKRQNGEINDTLLLLEHPAVITMGRRTPESHILAARNWLQDQGVTVEAIGRGGDVTYHGPGQLVGYAIFDLRDHDLGVRDYIEKLEEIIITTLQDTFALSSGRDAINRGVWIGTRKICAIGVAVKRSVTMHGFGLNLNTDLKHFEWIVPCGIQGRGVTSVQNETGAVVDIQKTAQAIADQFQKTFHYEQVTFHHAE
jgi:lipoyl(octanoyl) transferase